MPPKRKADVVEELSQDVPPGPSAEPSTSAAGSTKKARLENAPAEASSSAQPAAPKSWRDITLEGEDEGDVPVFDDCNDIRRKIRLLEKTPGFKITHWLRDIGNINSNSYSRFMKAKGATGGASNGTYYAAYVYFEKVRILEGKKKTAKRERNEDEIGANGFPLQDRSKVWVFTGR